MPAVDNVARIPIMRIMILVLLSRARLAKMERAAWVITPAHLEGSNPSLILAVDGRHVSVLGIMVQSAI
jgi:hypothetical protein